MGSYPHTLPRTLSDSLHTYFAMPTAGAANTAAAAVKARARGGDRTVSTTSRAERRLLQLPKRMLTVLLTVLLLLLHGQTDESLQAPHGPRGSRHRQHVCTAPERGYRSHEVWFLAG